MSNYQSLRAVFSDAAVHASEGKGKDRHATDVPYEDQLSTWINKQLGTNHFAIGQAVKKLIESTRLEPEHARSELLGALNYAATAVIVLDIASPGFTDEPSTPAPGDDERDVVRPQKDYTCAGCTGMLGTHRIGCTVHVNHDAAVKPLQSGIVKNDRNGWSSQCPEVGCALAFDHKPSTHVNKLGGHWTKTRRYVVDGRSNRTGLA